MDYFVHVWSAFSINLLMLASIGNCPGHIGLVESRARPVTQTCWWLSLYAVGMTR
jgi:hypothetical protein